MEHTTLPLLDAVTRPLAAQTLKEIDRLVARSIVTNEPVLWNHGLLCSVCHGPHLPEDLKASMSYIGTPLSEGSRGKWILEELIKLLQAQV